MLLSVLLFARITDVLGETQNLPMLKGKLFNAILKRSPVTIVFYIDSESDIEFAEFAVRTFKKKVIFLRASSVNGATVGCKSYPCVVPFKGEKPFPFESPPFTPIGFLDWVGRVLNPDVIKLTAPESLRNVFEASHPSLIGVDLESRPRNITKTKPFYTVNSSILEFFGVAAPTGSYLYRPADRELVPFNGDYLKLSNAGISEPSEINPRDKKLFAGFSVCTSTEEYSETEISLVKELQKKYGNSLWFANIHGASAGTYESEAQLEAVPKPYFFVLNVSDLSGGRWLIYRDLERMHDLEALSAFIDRVLAGEENYSIVSDPISADDLAQPLKRVVGDTINDFVLDTGKDVLIAITGPSAYTRLLVSLLNETARLLSDVPTLAIGVINGPTNDIPEFFPAISSYPVVLLWPSNRKTAPVKYDGPRKAAPLLDFLTNNTAIPFTVPAYNETELDERITSSLRRPRPSPTPLSQ